MGPQGPVGPQGPAGAPNPNAQTLNGLDSTKFVRSDVAASTVGPLTVTHGIRGGNSAGNFHLDADKSGSDGSLYLNWFSGNRIVMGQGAGDWSAIFGPGFDVNFRNHVNVSNTLNVVNSANVGNGGPCCIGNYTLSVSEATANNNRLPTITFHAGGVSEAQLVLATRDRQPTGQHIDGGQISRRTFMLVSQQDRVDLYVTGNIKASGNKSFVQPHPTDPSKEIVYVALEGGEAGTYARGSARLVGGEARVALPAHFALVTTPAGLTAQVTARERCGPLWVESIDPRVITVKAESPRASCRFDWLVQGVRRGQERFEPIVSR
jgi:hypothetical protein